MSATSSMDSSTGAAGVSHGRQEVLAKPTGNYTGAAGVAHDQQPWRARRRSGAPSGSSSARSAPRNYAAAPSARAPALTTGSSTSAATITRARRSPSWYCSSCSLFSGCRADDGADLLDAVVRQQVLRAVVHEQRHRLALLHAQRLQARAAKASLAASSSAQVMGRPLQR